MDSPIPFDRVMAALRAGDDAAARAVVDRFCRPLVAAAARQMSRRVRARTDPESAVQSGLRSFFQRAAAGQFDGLAGWDELWALLMTITLRKCLNRNRYHSRGRRDAAAEVPGEAITWEILAREPSPEEHAQFAESVERLLGRFDAEDRDVLELSLRGFTPTDIARETGRALRSVHRVRAQAREWLESELARGCGEPGGGTTSP